MVAYSLTEAAAATGRNRSVIWKSISKGRLSAHRDEATGRWLVEVSELHRVFPAASPNISNGITGNGKETAEMAALLARLEASEQRLADTQETVADLRRRLDTATEQLGEAWRQVRMLADQRATPPPVRRSWWARLKS